MLTVLWEYQFTHINYALRCRLTSYGPG